MVSSFSISSMSCHTLFPSNGNISLISAACASDRRRGMSVVDVFWSGFDGVLSSPESDILAIGSTIPIPHFPAADVIALCRLAVDHFIAMPTAVRLDGEVCVIGDLHGSFHDLLQIFRDQGLAARYLFLGDYVDRGAFSLEVITLLFTLMLRAPNNFTLIRGNHELQRVASNYGFRSELLGSDYPESVFDAFCEVFAWMPVAAVVQNAFLCVHGGIGPLVETIGQIEAIERPIVDDSDVPIVKSMLWSDPTPTLVHYTPSSRVGCLLYGPLAVKLFLEANSLRGIIRGHECVNGVAQTKGMPVFTVFSASNYLPGKSNDAGLLIIGDDQELRPKTLTPPSRKMTRDECSFFSFGRAENLTRLPLPAMAKLRGGEPSNLPRLLTSSRGLLIGPIGKRPPPSVRVLMTGRRSSLGHIIIGTIASARSPMNALLRAEH
jgi:diadenosine tetraphosphatase ApaH/serine/threonine PP2A family protein phosphatase